MRAAIAALVLFGSTTASSDPPFRDAESAQRYIDRSNLDQDRAFAERVAATRKKLGRAAFEPVTDLRPRDDRRAPKGLSKHPTDPQITLRVESARIAYVTFEPDHCHGRFPQTTALFARTDTGVKLVLVEPDLRGEVVKVPGSCGLPGCGTEPPPPGEIDTWLPVADPAAITVEHVRVPYLLRSLSCDHPSHPPAAPPRE